jgi:cell wall-associated NlpC family hydrolase
LTSAAASFDPRTTLARPDLAEQALEGVVRAEAFRAVRPMRCVVAVADIHATADAADAPVDQLIHGEAFDVLDTHGDRVWGQARRDGVVGWVRTADLAEGASLADCVVASTAAVLPLNALVRAADSAAVASAHVALAGVFADDPLSVAEQFLGAPHKPGGRSMRGIDCCGLVQQALYACGRAAPRYADQQAELGRAVPAAEARRGDLVLWLKADEGPWRGHSAFLLDGERVLHATSHHGAVVVEALSDALARYAADGFDAPVFRRL